MAQKSHFTIAAELLAIKEAQPLQILLRRVAMPTPKPQVTVLDVIIEDVDYIRHEDVDRQMEELPRLILDEAQRIRLAHQLLQATFWDDAPRGIPEIHLSSGFIMPQT